ncbi:MAG: restriction alleviation protein, Lar family [Mesorhizobium sp.]|nr:MAG: restriction alleviation protein, Lar family [Mesorhizobium sp.]
MSLQSRRHRTIGSSDTRQRVGFGLARLCNGTRPACPTEPSPSPPRAKISRMSSRLGTVSYLVGSTGLPLSAPFEAGGKMTPNACPFCTSTEVRPHVTRETRVVIVCDECGASGPISIDKAAAIESWNSRPWKADQRSALAGHR